MHSPHLYGGPYFLWASSSSLCSSWWVLDALIGLACGPEGPSAEQLRLNSALTPLSGKYSTDSVNIHFWLNNDHHVPAEEAGGMELMDWNQTLGFHMFDVFDTVPLIPFKPLQWACLPIAPPTSLHWCPVIVYLMSIHVLCEAETFHWCVMYNLSIPDTAMSL